MVPDLPDDFGASNENLPPGIKINKEHFTTDFLSLPLQNLLPVFNKTENCIRIRKFLRILQNPIDSSSLQGRNGRAGQKAPRQTLTRQGTASGRMVPGLFFPKAQGGCKPERNKGQKEGRYPPFRHQNPLPDPKTGQAQGQTVGNAVKDPGHPQLSRQFHGKSEEKSHKKGICPLEQFSVIETEKGRGYQDRWKDGQAAAKSGI